MTPEQWQDCLQRFCRGQFDPELSEKVSHKDPNLKLESFRFLALFGAQQSPACSVAQASKEEAESLLRRKATWSG